MIEILFFIIVFGVLDMQVVCQKFWDLLIFVLDMVVSKQLVKSVLGVGEDLEVDVKKEFGVGQNLLILEVLYFVNLLLVSL